MPGRGDVDDADDDDEPGAVIGEPFLTPLLLRLAGVGEGGRVTVCFREEDRPRTRSSPFPILFFCGVRKKEDEDIFSTLLSPLVFSKLLSSNCSSTSDKFEIGLDDRGVFCSELLRTRGDER